jgi:type II secretion system protein G
MSLPERFQAENIGQSGPSVNSIPLDPFQTPQHNWHIIRAVSLRNRGSPCHKSCAHFIENLVLKQAVQLKTPHNKQSNSPGTSCAAFRKQLRMKGAGQPSASKRIDPLRIFLVSLAAAVAMRTCLDRWRFNGCVYPKNKAAEAELGALKTSLNLFEVENHHYPGTNGLSDLVVQSPYGSDSPQWQHYLDKVPLDPWGHPYRYEFPGHYNTNSYDLSSAGPDGKFGTKDDIANWDPAKN